MEDSNSNRPKINNAAYAPAPKAEVPYQEVLVDHFDTDNFRRGLETNNQNEKINFLMMQNKSLRESINKQDEVINTLNKDFGKKLDLLIGELVTNKVYSFRHEEHNYIKIGYTGDLESRRKRHESEGWKYLGSRPGNQQNDEKMVKTILKKSGIKPVPGTKEQYKITPKLIDVLETVNWVGIKEYKDQLLKKDAQLVMDFEKS
tara:strand:- start:394 stop:1002 length:609 start_codon:yes stop_codon:yes gene_type:complete